MMNLTPILCRSLLRLNCTRRLTQFGTRLKRNIPLRTVNFSVPLVEEKYHSPINKPKFARYLTKDKYFILKGSINHVVDLFLQENALATEDLVHKLISACSKACPGLNLTDRQTLLDKIYYAMDKKSVSLYNAYIQACLDIRSSINPDDVLKEMKEQEVEPDDITWCHTFGQLCMLGQVDNALQLPRNFGLSDSERLAYLSYGYSLIGNLAKSKESLESFKSCKWDLSWKGLLVACQTLVKEGNLDECVSLFQSKCKTLPHMPVYELSVLLYDLLLQDAVDECKQILDEVNYHKNSMSYLFHSLSSLPKAPEVIDHSICSDLDRLTLNDNLANVMVLHYFVKHQKEVDTLKVKLDLLAPCNPKVEAMAHEYALMQDLPMAVGMLESARNSSNFRTHMLVPYILKGKAKDVVQNSDVPNLIKDIQFFLSTDQCTPADWFLVFTFLIKYDILDAWDWGESTNPAKFKISQNQFTDSLKHPLLGDYILAQYTDIVEKGVCIPLSILQNSLIDVYLKRKDIDKALDLLEKGEEVLIHDELCERLLFECHQQERAIPSVLKSHNPWIYNLILSIGQESFSLEEFGKTVQSQNLTHLSQKITEKMGSKSCLEDFFHLLDKNSFTTKTNVFLFKVVIAQAIKTRPAEEITNLMEQAVFYSFSGMQNKNWLLPEFCSICVENNRKDLIEPFFKKNLRGMDIQFLAAEHYFNALRNKLDLPPPSTRQFHSVSFMVCKWLVKYNDSDTIYHVLKMAQESTTIEYVGDTILANLILHNLPIGQVKRNMYNLDQNSLNRLFPMTYRSAAYIDLLMNCDKTFRQVFPKHIAFNTRFNFYLVRQMAHLSLSKRRRGSFSTKSHLAYAKEQIDQLGDINYPETNALYELLEENEQTRKSGKIHEYLKRMKESRLLKTGASFP